jgi:penicillin-binding protein 1C
VLLELLLTALNRQRILIPIPFALTEMQAGSRTGSCRRICSRVGRNDLPPRLRRLDPGPLAQAAAPGGAPKIVYPPDGALIEWRGEELSLEASGGKRPFRWLVDGKPLPPGLPRRTIYWQPEGIGFSQLTVIDADGHSARSTVRLSP